MLFKLLQSLFFFLSLKKCFLAQLEKTNKRGMFSDQSTRRGVWEVSLEVPGGCVHPVFFLPKDRAGGAGKGGCLITGCKGSLGPGGKSLLKELEEKSELQKGAWAVNARDSGKGFKHKDSVDRQEMCGTQSQKGERKAGEPGGCQRLQRAGDVARHLLFILSKPPGLASCIRAGDGQFACSTEAWGRAPLP